MLHLGDHIGMLPKREPIVASPDESLRTVARRLWSESVGAVVVVGAGGRAIGVLSERDIVKALATGSDPDLSTAGQVMTDTVISVRPDDVLLDVAWPMVDHGVRHVPIIADSGRVVGVLSMRDLLRPLIVDALEHGTRATTDAGG